MAFSPLPNNRTRARYRARYQPMSEINVTPFVDVMLVLLIIFMVAAPLLTVGVAVNLPKANARTLQGDDDPLAITVDARGQIFLQDTPTQLDRLVPQLKAITQEGYDRRIYVRGDRDLVYGKLASVIAEINRAGFSRVALVTDTPSTRAGRRR